MDLVVPTLPTDCSHKVGSESSRESGDDVSLLRRAGSSLDEVVGVGDLPRPASLKVTRREPRRMLKRSSLRHGWWRTDDRVLQADRGSIRRSRLGAIYGRELANVRRRLATLGVPTEDLADVAHDVFVGLMEHPIRRPADWHLLPARLVKRTYAAARVDQAGRQVTEGMGPEALRISDPRGAPDQFFDLNRLVDRALGAVEGKFRVVLTMHVVRGLRQRDIARELGMPSELVHQLIQEGRYKLRCRLERELRKT